jgi:RND superfamily putative drug exporter
VDSADAVTASGRPGGGEPLVVDGRVRVDAVVEDAAHSDAAKRAVERLRAEVHAIPGADALVGGYTAQQDDAKNRRSVEKTRHGVDSKTWRDTRHGGTPPWTKDVNVA